MTKLSIDGKPCSNNGTEVCIGYWRTEFWVHSSLFHFSILYLFHHKAKQHSAESILTCINLCKILTVGPLLVEVHLKSGRGRNWRDPNPSQPIRYFGTAQSGNDKMFAWNILYIKWYHTSVMASQITDNSTVCSTSCSALLGFHERNALYRLLHISLADGGLL